MHLLSVLGLFFFQGLLSFPFCAFSLFNLVNIPSYFITALHMPFASQNCSLPPCDSTMHISSFNFSVPLCLFLWLLLFTVEVMTTLTSCLCPVTQHSSWPPELLRAESACKTWRSKFRSIGYFFQSDTNWQQS